MKYALGFLLIFCGTALAATGYIMNNSKFFETSKHANNIIQPIFQDLKTDPSPAQQPRNIVFSAEIEYESEQQALLSLSSASGILKEILPSWYILNSGGIIRSLKSNIKDEIIQLCIESGIAIIPTLSAQWEKTTSHFLSTNEKKFQTIGKIVDLVEKENYAGINIDIQTIPEEQQDEMIKFTKTICNELQTKKKTCYLTLNEQRQDSSGKITRIIPFSKNIKNDIQKGLQNKIYNFSFQFLGNEDPSVWTVLSGIQP